MDNQILRVDRNYFNIHFTKKEIRPWETIIRLHTEGKIIETEDLEI
jgi:hypothetical protein